MMKRMDMIAQAASGEQSGRHDADHMGSIIDGRDFFRRTLKT
jgi:hypothetical protein